MKIKNIVVSVIFLCIASQLLAQKKANTIAILVGSSFPMGSYSATDLRMENSGLSKLGKNLSLILEHKINTTFAAAVNVFFQQNPLNTKGISNFLSETGYQTPGTPSTVYLFPDWKIEKKQWTHIGLSIGCSNEFPIYKEKYFFKINSSIGLAQSTMPLINGSSQTGSSTVFFTRSKKSGIGFNYQFGFDLKYVPNKKYFVIMNVQYFSIQNLRFKDINTTFYGEYFYNAPLSITFDNKKTHELIQNVSTLNASLGLGIKL
jgi:hypothetical protein